MDDLTNLTDEELDQKIESDSQLDQSPSITSNSEPTTEAEPVVEEEKEESAEAEVVETDEAVKDEEVAPVSPRENLRIQKILEKYGQPNQPVNQPEPAQAVPTAPTGLDYSTALDADQEVINQLEADRRAYGQSQYNQGLEQAKSIQFHTRLEIDAPKVESKFPQLNPSDRENFNPSLANAINTWYLKTTGYNEQTDTVQNPNIRYSEFAESIMELGDVIGTQKAVNAAKNVAKQAATTGLRPDGSAAKRLDLNKTPGAMTDEELDAILARSFSK